MSQPSVPQSAIPGPARPRSILRRLSGAAVSHDFDVISDVPPLVAQESEEPLPDAPHAPAE